MKLFIFLDFPVPIQRLLHFLRKYSKVKYILLTLQEDF